MQMKKGTVRSQVICHNIKQSQETDYCTKEDELILLVYKKHECHECTHLEVQDESFVVCKCLCKNLFFFIYIVCLFQQLHSFPRILSGLQNELSLQYIDHKCFVF